MIIINKNIITVDDYSVTKKLDGNNVLKFQINVNNENYGLIRERESIAADDQGYKVISIDRDLGNATVTAEISWSPWKRNAISNFTTDTPVSLSQLIGRIIPFGWGSSIYNSSSKKRLVKCDGVCSSYDILQKAHEYFDFAVQIDNNINRIYIYQDPSTYIQGGAPVVVMDGLNLDRLEYKGKANDFYTVLYAEGKDGMTFADINGGRAYIQDLSYSGEMITAYWKDERYTVKENLLEDARAKLQKASRPNITYTCSVKDLYAIDSTEYSNLRIDLLSTVRIKDYVKDESIDMKVTEYETHPLNPEKNVITMSSTIQEVKGLTQTINDAVAEEATVRKTEVDIAFEKMQEIIDSSSGLYCTTVTDPGGASIYYLHDQPALADSTIIWRMAADIVSVSTNGGSTWNAGITATGEVIANRLSVVGIDAEWIRIGKIAESQLATALQTKIDSNITGVSVQYAKNQSSTTAPTTGWQDNAPAWEEGYYIWQRTATTDANGTTTYSAALCITGVKGDTGNTGVGISSIVPQWYLSTSDQSTTGGTWSNTQPTWESGKYYWTRSRIFYDDGTIGYTTEVLANGENSANSNAAAAVSTANTASNTASSAVSTANAASQAAAAATGISETVRDKLIALCTDNNMTYIDGGVIAAATILANAIDLNDLFAQNITATNFHLAGGSIDIGTDSAVYDVISLTYGTGATQCQTRLSSTALGVSASGGTQIAYYGGEFAGVEGTVNGNQRVAHMEPNSFIIGVSTDHALSRNLMVINEEAINIRDNTSANKVRMSIGKTDLAFLNASEDMLVDLADDYFVFKDGTGGKYERMVLHKDGLRFYNSGGLALAWYLSNKIELYNGSGSGTEVAGFQTSNPTLYGNGTKLTANFINNTGSGWTLLAGVFRPTVNSDLDLGGSSYKWKQIYSIYSTISTSDRNEKHDIEGISEDYLRLFDLLEPVSYKRNGGDRTHIGFISQDVEEALHDAGMTADDFAGFCRDIKTSPEEYDENGNVVKEEAPVLDDNGEPVYIYSLRYEEFIALNTAKIKAMEQYIKTLEDRITALESKITLKGGRNAYHSGNITGYMPGKQV